MVEEVVHQRIKFLIQHGELYPTPQSNFRLIRKLCWLLTASLAIELFLVVEIWLK